MSPFLLLQTATVHKMQFYRLLVHNVDYALWTLMLKINAVVWRDLYWNSVEKVQLLFKFLLLWIKSKWVGGRHDPWLPRQEKKLAVEGSVQEVASFPWLWGKYVAVTLLAFFNCSWEKELYLHYSHTCQDYLHCIEVLCNTEWGKSFVLNQMPPVMLYKIINFHLQSRCSLIAPSLLLLEGCSELQCCEIQIMRK